MRVGEDPTVEYALATHYDETGTTIRTVPAGPFAKFTRGEHTRLLKFDREALAALNDRSSKDELKQRQVRFVEPASPTSSPTMSSDTAGIPPPTSLTPMDGASESKLPDSPAGLVSAAETAEKQAEEAATTPARSRGRRRGSVWEGKDKGKGKHLQDRGISFSSGQAADQIQQQQKDLAAELQERKGTGYTRSGLSETDSQELQQLRAMQQSTTDQGFIAEAPRVRSLSPPRPPVDLAKVHALRNRIVLPKGESLVTRSITADALLDDDRTVRARERYNENVVTLAERYLKATMIPEEEEDTAEKDIGHKDPVVSIATSHIVNDDNLNKAQDGTFHQNDESVF